MPPLVTRTLALAPILLLSGLIAIACSSAGPSGSPGIPTPQATPSGAVPSGGPPASGLTLRIAADGGFVPPGFLVTRLPQLSVYADGRAIEPGAVPAIYPGPASQPLVAHQLDAAALDRLRQAARSAGLAGLDRAWTAVDVADVETTVLTFVDGAGTHVHSFYALGFPPSGRASAEERAARQAASELVQVAGTIVSGTPGTSWTRAAYRIYTSPVDDPAPSLEPAPNVLDWPAGLPSLASLEPLPRGLAAFGCGVIDGDRLASFTALLVNATQITRYRDGGREWTLLVRPLLPDETRTCG